ncbi:MAG: ABC transporter permease [Acidobacteria bacterium]|nr:ABC transporter permease [Acidobacteriota bacterium]
MVTGTPAEAQEYRGFWVDTFNTALNNHDDVLQVVANAMASNANALFVQAHPVTGHRRGVVRSETRNVVDTVTILVAQQEAAVPGGPGRTAVASATDGTGYYGAVDLAPGTYRVTVTPNGQAPFTGCPIIVAGRIGGHARRSPTRGRTPGPVPPSNTPVPGRGTSVIMQWTSDLRHAWRALLRTPGFLVTSVVTLALAIGAVVGMFSVVNTVLLRPLPFPDADRLVVVTGTAPGSDLPDRFGLGNEFYLHYKERSQLIEGIFLFAGGTSTLRTDDRVERIPMAWPTNDVYATLGARPQMGRLPTPEDEDRVVLISDRLWTTWFGRDPAVIGTSYFVSGEMREVIGVMPPEFSFPSDQTLLWVASAVQPADVRPGQLGAPVVARMKPGVTREQLAAELTRISKELPEKFGGPPTYARMIEQHSAVVDPLLDRLVGPTARTSLWVLLGAVSVVLLIACANVANLFLVRAEGRRRDLAVRRAIGASRAQLVRLQMAEAFLVAMPAGVLAVCLSALTLPLFLRAAPEGIPRLGLAGLDLPTLAAAFALVVIATCACGAAPALHASSPDLSRLREGSRGSTGRRHWGRDALVVGQTALALVLLIGSALLVQSFQRLRSVDPGYDTADIYTFQFAPEQDHLTDGPGWGRLHLDFMDRLRALPGVTAVGVVNNIPLDEGTGTGRFLTDAMDPNGGGALLDRNFTGGDYFRVMGIDVLRGRPFTQDEAVTPNSHVMISRSAAARLWPAQDPLGQRIRPAGATAQWFTVVGVVEDVKQDDWRDAGEAIVYFPLTGPTPGSWAMGSPAYVIKSPRAASLGREVRELVRQVAPEAPVYREFTMEFLAQRSMVQLSFTMLTLGVISALAMILGAVGLYGVLSYVVAERTREIGVRMALGATAGSVRRLVVSEGAKVVLVGAVVGAAAALASTRLLAALLYEVSAVDPLVFVAMSTMLIGVGMLASYVPAHRASRVDPIESLRND